MITQDQLYELVRKWPINYTPEYRRYTCADCGKTMAKAWHVHFLEYGYKREIHLCRNCGKKYNLKVSK